MLMPLAMAAIFFRTDMAFSIPKGEICRCRLKARSRAADHGVRPTLASGDLQHAVQRAYYVFPDQVINHERGAELHADGRDNHRVRSCDLVEPGDALGAEGENSEPLGHDHS